MNWDAIAAVSQVVGSIAVIVTLIYLARQVRQSTAALRSAATQGAHDQAADFYGALSSDPELVMVVARGIETPDELSDAERGQFYCFFMRNLFNFQNWYLQTQDGLMDDALLASWSRIATGFTGTPGFKQFWADRGHIYAPEFVNFMETQIISQERDEGFRPLGIGLRT